MTRVLLLSGLLALSTLVAGCASTAMRGPPLDLEVLVYETEAAFMCGRCDSLKFSLAADGRMWIERGHWAPGRTVWLRDRRFEQVSPETAAQVLALVAPYRPAVDAPEHSAACEERFPDQGGVHLSWRSGGSGKTIRYSGCDPAQNEVLRQRLNDIPGLLGVKIEPHA